jgi:hypothetical protein
MQLPRHSSLGDAVMTGQPPGARTRESFYGMPNVFHMGTPATSWFTNICHNEPQTTYFPLTTFQKNECPEILMLSSRIHVNTQVCSGCTDTLSVLARKVNTLHSAPLFSM